MDRIGKVGNLRQLPVKVINQIGPGSLIFQAQAHFFISAASVIDNTAYWDIIGEDFETGKIDDHTLDPQLRTFFDILADPQRAIVEFGCGIGRAADSLVSQGFRNYLGADVAEKVIEIARGRNTGLEFRVGNILTFNSQRHFDAAIVTDVLLYLSPFNQIRALLNLSDLLKRGALVLLRWAPGRNEFLIKDKKSGARGWVFLASEEYIKILLKISGFILERPVLREAVVINPGTSVEKTQEYLVIFARKKS